MKTSILGASRTHPASWWLLGLAFVLTASMATSPLPLILLSATSMLLVLLFRDESPWAKSVRFYLQLAAIVIIIRVLFRVIFNLEVSPDQPFIVLPELNIDLGFSTTIHLFGSMSQLSFVAALTDGLRLSAIILAIGMANSLANPRKLLKATPGALYELATAISIAINLAPQLITSLNRVRRARGLRGQSKGMKALPGIVIPVLEDTIDQSMSLAASMSARGFGRKGDQTKTQQLLARLLGLSSIVLITLGAFMLLITPSSQLVDLALICFGVFFAFLYIKMSALGSVRTRFQKDPWRLGDLLILASAVLLLICGFSGVIGK